METGEKESLRIGEGKPGPGRPKGVPNKVNGQLRDMILQALDGAGGVEYLQRQADANPGAFLSLIGRVLPMQVQGDIAVSVRKIERVIVDPCQKSSG